MDALEQSHPIGVEVHHARSMEEIFDSISYKKGSAVIRMLQGYLGDGTFQVCYKVMEIASDAIPAVVNGLKQFFIDLLLISAEKSGWESISGESHLNALLRGEVFLALATFGHNKTHKEAIQRFQMLLNDRNTCLLSADTRKAAFIVVMLNASTTDRNGFESLLKLYREADTVQEKELVLCCLASCPDPNILLEVLNFMLSDEV